LELPGGSSKEYGEVLEKYEKNISLEELSIPPIGLKKSRKGGMLIEIRCKDQEEEKAEQLAQKIREIVGSREGAVVRCPLFRLRLKLTRLPLDAAASGIAEAVAKASGGRPEKVKVGPLRILASGVGSTWIECPKEMAFRVAGATGWKASLVEREAPQCFRCLGRGHFGRWCPSEVDRGGAAA